MFPKLPNKKKSCKKDPRQYTSIEHTWEKECSCRMKIGIVQQACILPTRYELYPRTLLRSHHHIRIHVLKLSHLSFPYPLWIYNLFSTFTHVSISSKHPLSNHFAISPCLVCCASWLPLWKPIWLFGVYSSCKWMQRQTWFTVSNLNFDLFV